MNKYVLQLFAVIFFPIIVGATQQDERITAEKIRMNFSNPVIDETGKKYEIECVKAALDNGENGIGAIYPDLYELAISIVRENLNNPRLYTGVWGDYKCHNFDYLF